MQVLAAKFGSAARKAGFEEGFDIVEIKLPSGRASPYWFYLPGLVLIVLVWRGPAPASPLILSHRGTRTA